MEACTIPTAPVVKPEAAPSGGQAQTAARWICLAASVTLAVGLLWRAVRYFGCFPIWGDEAMVLLNLLDRDYAGLTEHLRYAQVAPLFFLWMERTALLVAGSSEWSVRFVPCLASFVGMLMFWRACKDSLTAPAAGMAVAMLAVSYYPIRHGSEAKPYALDLCFAAFCLWMALHQLRNPEQSRALIGLAIVTPLAVFASYPSVFVSGAVSLALLPSMRRATWTQRSLWVLFNVLMVAAFITHHGIIAHSQIDAAEAEASREFLRNYWKNAFAPDSVLDWPIWLLKIFTGNMLAHPVGANHGGSVVTFLLVLLGSFKLARERQAGILAVCWLPFAMNLIAAIAKKYPFGDSARITLHLAPFVCVLAAYGLAQILDWVRNADWRNRTHLAFYALLLACGIFGIARDVVHPYKTEHDRDVRLLAHDIARQVGDDPVLMGHPREENIIPELSWYLRTEGLALAWQPATVSESSTSCWLVTCANEPPGPATAPSGWRIDSSGVRFVQSENNVMPSMYCRWTHLVRE